MKVKEFIKALQEFDPELEIVVGSDDEGNDWLNPYAPNLAWAVEDEDMRCGWRPVDDMDVEDGEYDGLELKRLVAM